MSCLGFECELKLLGFQKILQWSVTQVRMLVKVHVWTRDKRRVEDVK